MICDCFYTSSEIIKLNSKAKGRFVFLPLLFVDGRVFDGRFQDLAGKGREKSLGDSPDY
jgi:hypothetical protein